MAVDFHLNYKTDSSLSQVTSLILNLDGFEIDDKETNFKAKGLVGGVFAASDFDQRIVQENFDFVPTISIWFRPSGYDDYEVGMQNGLRAFIEVLKQNGGDAVCIMNGESVKFVRVNGKLSLNSESFYEEDSVWTFDQVPIPFEAKQYQILE